MPSFAMFWLAILAFGFTVYYVAKFCNDLFGWGY